MSSISSEKDAGTIVNQKSVLWVTWRRQSQLLAGPLGGRLLRQIPVEDPSALHLQDPEHVHQLESQGNPEAVNDLETPRGIFLSSASRQSAPSLAFLHAIDR